VSKTSQPWLSSAEVNAKENWRILRFDKDPNIPKMAVKTKIIRTISENNLPICAPQLRSIYWRFSFYDFSYSRACFVIAKLMLEHLEY
jgi:hypothetical protein